MSWDYLLTTFIVCAASRIGAGYTLSATLGAGLRGGLRAALARA
ncbi:MAG: hypothetical protein ACK5IP_20135 [Paracoccus sp. (in: a-proteobacteria)]